jgi:hypothetical protein
MGRYTFARYANAEKNAIEAIWYNEDEENPVYNEIWIDVNLRDQKYRELLETFSVDEISTMTDQHAKEANAIFQEHVKKIAEDYNMIYNPEAENNHYAQSVDMIFEPQSGDVGEEFLFDLKLKIFEMDEVVNSDNEDLQAELREADSPLKALYIAGKFLFE